MTVYGSIAQRTECLEHRVERMAFRDTTTAEEGKSSSAGSLDFEESIGLCERGLAEGGEKV